MTQLPIETRQIIQNLHRQGWSRRRISRKFKCTLSTVQKWVNQPQNTENKYPIRGRGRRPKIQEKDKKIVKNILLENNLEGTSKLTGIVKELISIDISESTLRRYATSLGLKWGRPRIKPILSKENQEVRLQWARSHIKEIWVGWMFTDEKTFRIGTSPSGMRYESGDFCTWETKRWCEQVNVWYGIHISKKISPQIITGRLNSDKYIEILSRAFRNSKKRKWIFQQDNAPVHVSKKSRDWLEQNCIPICPDFPPYSPDLNPIENLWSIVNRLVIKSKPQSKAELEKTVLKVLEEIPQQVIESLILSMPSRIQAVIESKGGHTKY